MSPQTSDSTSRRDSRPARRGFRRLILTAPWTFPLAVVVALSPAGPLQAQDAADDVEEWDVTAPRGETREVDFTTSEGTWMSVDLAADGDWVVFDLLGHVYRVAASGGEAVSLTQNSGVAVNYHPRFSPDGSTIAFVSDRGGQNNLWLMDADGSNPRPVFESQSLRAWEPAWSPDGRFIVVRRAPTRRGSGGAGLWMYSRDGGEGVELVGSDYSGAAWPAFSPDGGSLYFQIRTAPAGTWSGRTDLIQGHKQIRRLDLETGQVDEITSGITVQQGQTSSGSGIAPEISPDGRWLAFARRIPDGTISHKGLRFGPRTALWLRDLETGAERLLMDPIEVDMAEGMKVSRDLPGLRLGAGRPLDRDRGGGQDPPGRCRERRGVHHPLHGSRAAHHLGDGGAAAGRSRRDLHGEVPALDRLVTRREPPRVPGGRAHLGDGPPGRDPPKTDRRRLRALRDVAGLVPRRP